MKPKYSCCRSVVSARHSKRLNAELTGGFVHDFVVVSYVASELLRRDSKEIGRKIFETHHVRPAFENRAVDDVLELADIAGPVVFFKRRQHFGRNATHDPRRLPSVLDCEVMCERGNVFTSFA